MHSGVRGVVSKLNKPTQIGSSQSAYGFTNEPTGSNGFLYLRARYLRPTLGQFLSLDAVERGNRYSYVGGNPVNRRDPSGLIALIDEGDGGGPIQIIRNGQRVTLPQPPRAQVSPTQPITRTEWIKFHDPDHRFPNPPALDHRSSKRAVSSVSLGGLDCSTLTNAYSTGSVDRFRRQFDYSAEEAVTVLAASWNNCRQQLQRDFLGVQMGSQRIDNAEAYLRQFVAKSGYTPYLNQYDWLINSRANYYGIPMVDPKPPAPEPDVLGLVVGARFDLSGTLGILGLGVGGDVNLELQLMPWHLQPEYFGKRYLFNIAINPSVEGSTSPGVNSHGGIILGLMETEQFATSGGAAETYGIDVAAPFGGFSLEGDLVVPVGTRGGILYLGFGGEAGPPGVYTGTGTTGTVWDLGRGQ